MLPSLIYTITFMVFSASAIAYEVDLSWLQNILKAKQVNEGKNRQMAYEIVQGIRGITDKVSPDSNTETGETQKVCRSTVEQLQAKSVEDRYPSLLVFVSFSMPIEALKAIGHQVNKAGGKLVLRGLVEDSFPKTSEKMRELGVDSIVDPTLFEAFEINVCPVYVLLDEPIRETDSTPSHDKLSGHVSLHQALDTFRKNGNPRAATLLQSLHGGAK